MVEGHVSVRACGFESRSGHKHKSRKAAITAAFLVLQPRSGPVVGPLLQKLQKIGIVLLHAIASTPFSPLQSTPTPSGLQTTLARLLQALVRWMFAHHRVAFAAHCGVGNAFRVYGALEVFHFMLEVSS